MSHPCLCNICLGARGIELSRLKQYLLEEVEKIIGKDEEMVKLPVMQSQEQNNFEKENRNELRKWQREALTKLKGEKSE